MKRVNGKYIRLTEQQMKNIIAEEVKKQLQIIMEYAIPRQEFIRKVNALSKQIIENWCLVHYCTITSTDVNQCKNHWKNELSAHLHNVGNEVIKGNKDVSFRQKAVHEAFDWSDFFENPEHIFVVISNKFKKEGIDIKSKEVEQVVNDCYNEIENIVFHIANYFHENINEYIEAI